MDTPTTKRRRVDAAAKVLSKPFRSPFKTARQTSEASYSSSQLATKTDSDHEKTLDIDTTPNCHTSKRGAALIPKSRPIGPPISAAALNTDPSIAPLVKAQRALEKQLRELKEELDVAEQARKIEADSYKRDPKGEIDGELLELITSWRTASRRAAEELFSGVQEKVNRMGGPKAWRESQARQKDFLAQFNEQPLPPQDSYGEEEGEGQEERDLYAEYGEPETENEKVARDDDLAMDDGPDDEFTIATMLKTMNIDLKVIGYDKGEQRWTEENSS